MTTLTKPDTVSAPTEPPRLLLTPREACIALAIKSRKLWSLTAGREIECVRIGRLVRYEPKALQDYIEKQKRAGRP